MIRLRAKAASTSYSLPLSLHIILSYTRPAAPSSGTPPYGFVATMDREDRRGSGRDVGYGITDS
ncbi:hypothetical protein Tco_0319575, partial [Tanacetum coccineum]